MPVLPRRRRQGGRLAVAEQGSAIRRRRECLECGRRYTSYERVEEVSVLVRKRSGRVVPFDLAKLTAGIERAASGRLAAPVIVTLAADVEEQLRESGAEVSSDAIGVAVLARLRALDQVAYLRFASVYKGFEDAADFARELGELQKTTAPRNADRPVRGSVPAPGEAARRMLSEVTEEFA